MSKGIANGSSGLLLEPTLTEDVSWTPVFAGTFGTVSGVNAKWHREGKYMVGSVYGRPQALVGGTCTISLPAGHNIDFSIASDQATILGQGFISDDDATVDMTTPDHQFIVCGQAADPTKLYISDRLNTGGSGNGIAAGYTIPPNISGTLQVHMFFNFKIPITEFSIGSGFLGAVPGVDAEKLQGVDISTSAPTDKHVLTYNNSTTKWEPAVSDKDAETLRGINIHTVAPTDGQALVYSSVDGRWEAGAGGGGAADDLSSATTIINISGAAAPAAGQVLTATSATTAIWKTPTDPSQSVGIGIFSGGLTGGAEVNIIESIAIETLGNSIDFGDLTVARHIIGCCSSTTRGVTAGGHREGIGWTNVIDYITIASSGNAIDFGNLSTTRRAVAGFSSQTRGVFAGGYSFPAINIIEYITIASTGNGTDFGDLSIPTDNPAGMSSPTRGLICGGNNTSTLYNKIEYVTIASTGNASDFGDLLLPTLSGSACSNSSRGLYAGGNISGSYTDRIQYVTMATLGNAVDFGDLSSPSAAHGACSTSTRAVFGGGIESGSQLSRIEYVGFTTLGNASSFGDLTSLRTSLDAMSNAHGGL